MGAPVKPKEPLLYLSDTTVLFALFDIDNNAKTILAPEQKEMIAKSDYFTVDIYSDSGDYSDDRTVDIGFMANEPKPNPKYDEQLVKYEADLAHYEKANAQWEENIRVSKEKAARIEAQRIEKEERATLEKLKAKYE